MKTLTNGNLQLDSSSFSQKEGFSETKIVADKDGIII